MMRMGGGGQEVREEGEVEVRECWIRNSQSHVRRCDIEEVVKLAAFRFDRKDGEVEMREEEKRAWVLWWQVMKTLYVEFLTLVVEVYCIPLFIHIYEKRS